MGIGPFTVEGKKGMLHSFGRRYQVTYCFICDSCGSKFLLEELAEQSSPRNIVE